VLGANKETEKTQKKVESSRRDSAVTILTSGCTFKGKLYCRGSTRIGGRIEGEVFSEGLLIIEEEATIEANIKADEVVLQGRINGVLEANNRVELCSTCRFTGNILTPTLIIREGANFNGSASMNLEPNAEVPNKAKDGDTAIPEVNEKDFEKDSGTNVVDMKAPEVKVNL
jgi:cytoskeletal protein CcmA (bactofilin family)